MDLSHRIIAVVGGDEREQEIARLAALTGATVRGFGLPWPDDPARVEGVQRANSASAALDGAHYALFPIPGIAADGSLFAPECPTRIVPDRHLLSRMAPDGSIILGGTDTALREAGTALGLRFSEYEDDVELMLLRGPAIVEGVLQIAIANTDITLHHSTVAVVGHGNIGRLLTRQLVLLGARVHLFARNPVQRADAVSGGSDAHPLTEFTTWAPQLQIVFSTVPHSVLTHKQLVGLPRGALVMDLAAPPGGIDLGAAQELGHRAIWARGLGRRAPITVGASQWSGIVRRIEELEQHTTDRKGVDA